MSSDIIIFQSPEEAEQVVKEHRDIEYEKLLNDFGVQNAYHIDNLLDMGEKYSSMKSYWISSNILSILAKQVITYTIPIIKEIPKIVDLSTENNDHDIKAKDFFIQLQVNHEIHGFIIDENKSLNKIAIPSETSFRIIGIKVPSILLPHLDYTISMPIHPFISDVIPMILSGNYNYETIAKTKSNIPVFTEQLLDIRRTNEIEFTEIIFENAQQAKDLIEKILRNITHMRDYYTNFIPFFIQTKIPPLIKSNIYEQLLDKQVELPEEIADLFYHPFINQDGFKEKLISEDLWILYNKIRKLGTNNQEINHEIQNKKLSNKIKRDMVSQAKEVSLKIVDDFRKQAIVNKKFPGKNLKDLKPKEKELIQKEFDIQIRKLKNLKDPAIKTVVHDFLKSFESLNTAILLKKSYDEVKELVKSKNLNLIDIGLCDHYMKHAELLLEGYKSGTIYKARAAFDIREKLINEFTNSETTINEEYYCKLCGQLIAMDSNSEVVEFIGETRIDSGYEVDALNELIYRDVSHIVRTFIKFKTLPPDLRPIIKSIVNTLTPEMHVVETKLKQIQTNISDDMRDLMGMYIYIYTFALVSHMIFVNYGQITFAFREGALGGMGNQKPMRSSRKTGLHKKSNLIINKDNGQSSDDESDSEIINEIENKLSAIKSKPSLLYDNEESNDESNESSNDESGEDLISGGDGGDSSDNAKERLQNILKNALYLINTTKIKMLKTSANIGPDKVKPILLQAYQWVLKLQTYKEAAISETDVNFEILSSLINSSIYNYLWTVKSIKFPKTRFEDVTSVIGISIDQIRDLNYKSKKEKINPFKSAVLISEKDWKKSGYDPYDEYTFGSYLQSASYEKEEKYRYHITPLEEPLIKHYENAKKLLKIEQRLRFQRRFIENNRTFNNIPRTFNYTNAQDIKFNIGRYYRPDGSKRKWDIMILESIDKTNKSDSITNVKSNEYTFDDLKKLDYETRKSLKIVDRKDGNDLLSDVKDYTQVVNAKFESVDYNKSLLEYFENRCPEGGIHEFSNSDICMKCARDMNASWVGTPKSDDYIKKYSQIFSKHNNLKSSLVKLNLTKILKSIEVHEFKFTKFEPWTYSEVQLLEWSRLNPKINLNMILNLGCSEHRKYHIIEKERDNPIKTYENDEHLGRINKLDSYYNSIIRDYYSVKNYQLAEFPPLFYREIIDKFKNDISKLPDLKDSEYDKKIEWYKIAHNSEAHLIGNFILIQIANIIIYVSKLGTYGKALAELLTMSLILKDKMFSKPDPFKISIDKRTKDDEYASDTSSEGSDLTDASEVESIGNFEVESDTNEQKQDTEAYNFGLEDTGIVDVNDGNDDDESSDINQDAPAA